MGVTETVCFLRRTFYKLIRELFILRESQKPTPYLYLPFRKVSMQKQRKNFGLKELEEFRY